MGSWTLLIPTLQQADLDINPTETVNGEIKLYPLNS